MSGRYWQVVVEALRFLEPQDLLLVDLVSTEWQYCSRLDEVWTGQLLTTPDEDDARCARDICREQLTRPHVFAHFHSSDLLLYDLWTGKMRSMVLPRSFISTSYGAWVSLPKKILYCGGMLDEYVATSFLIGINTIAVERLPDMITNRAGGGLIYTAGRVYVFGGDNADRRGRIYGNLSACEKLSVVAKTWSALPDMRSCRRSFSPTLRKDRIYIAGGGGADNSVEVFCTHSERFLAPCALRLQFANALSAAFAVGDTLVVLGPSAAWQYDINSGSVIKRMPLSRKYWYSPGAPVVHKGSWYFGIYYDERVWKIGADLLITAEDFSV